MQKTEVAGKVCVMNLHSDRRRKEEEEEAILFSIIKFLVNFRQMHQAHVVVFNL